MAWWAAGNARTRQGPQAREGARLDRRVLGVSRAGTGPAPSQNIFIGNLVIVHGTGATSGVFIYNGAPALGNPPQIAEVPSGVTQDPYGNAITLSKILMQGNIITLSGGIFRTSGTSPLIQLDGPHNAYLQYDAGIHLSESIAPATTSDGLGNTVQAGFTSYGGAGIFARLGAAVLTFFSTGNLTNPSLSSAASNLAASSGTVTGSTVSAKLTLVAGTTGGVATVDIASSAVLLENVAAPSQNLNGPLASGSGGFLRVISGATGDTSSYQSTGRITAAATSTPQTVNSTTGQAVTGITFPVASGITYEFYALLFCTVGPNPLSSAAAVTGPATTFMSLEIEGMDTKHGSVATALGGGNQVAMGALTNYINTGTIPAADTFTVKIRGRFTTSASGTVGINVNTTAAANTYTINNGSYATLMPSA